MEICYQFWTHLVVMGHIVTTWLTPCSRREATTLYRLQYSVNRYFQTLCTARMMDILYSNLDLTTVVRYHQNHGKLHSCVHESL